MRIDILVDEFQPILHAKRAELPAWRRDGVEGQKMKETRAACVLEMILAYLEQVFSR